MKKKILSIGLIMLSVGMLFACGKKAGNETEKNSENNANYITSAIAPELYSIMFEKEPSKYEISYDADYFLTEIDGENDTIYIETFFIYESDENGKLSSCKTVMVTKSDLNQKHMEEYLKMSYGENYVYSKPYDNVYVHFEKIEVPVN